MTPENTPILDLEVPLIVQIAARSMPVKDVVALEPGAIIEFPRSADEDLEILINNKAVGQGVVFAVRGVNSAHPIWDKKVVEGDMGWFGC